MAVVPSRSARRLCRWTRGGCDFAVALALCCSVACLTREWSTTGPCVLRCAVRWLCAARLIAALFVSVAIRDSLRCTALRCSGEGGREGEKEWTQKQGDTDGRGEERREEAGGYDCCCDACGSLFHTIRSAPSPHLIQRNTTAHHQRHTRNSTRIDTKTISVTSIAALHCCSSHDRSPTTRTRAAAHGHDHK